ncbi:MAG TPA: serine/threonine-protein kinase [Acidobacteriota bacterium]|nr:serine/threonine-protein kinase [Acidobacteriota bacterium]
MKRWSQVERLFNQALELPPADRKAFLEKTCSRDDYLKNEVESLLEYHQRAESFIETSAIETEAKKLAQEKLEDVSGRRLGPYTLISLIGIGGMACVYRARDERSGEMVALKLLPPGLVADEYRLRRFNREAKALRRLSHKNIAQFYEAGEAEGQNYIAMELVEGRNLEDVIRNDRLTEGQILRIAIQVVEALKSAHARKVMHRDIKPSNLIIRESGEVKVLDFGLAKALTESGVSSKLDLSLESLTRTGTVLGTVEYMSPEQIRGGEIDHRTDLFSVGVMMYQMSTGRFPFHGKSYGDTIRRILDEPPSHMRDLGSESPPSDLKSIVLACLQKEPSKRYQSAEELLQALKIALGEPLDSVKGGAGRRGEGKKKLYWVFAAAALLAIVILWMILAG